MSAADWTVDWVVNASGGRLSSAPRGYGGIVFRGVSTDSRTIASCELFVALTGPNYDGHQFLAAAVEAGAAGLLVRKGCAVPTEISSKVPVICAEDTLTALGDMAHTHRKAFGVPIVAVTGSMGKTTSKDMLGEILKAHYGADALITHGNFNNLIGMPLILLGLRAHHRAAVLELGMNTRGEIRLARIAMPDIGVITCVSEVHMEHLTSIGAIAEAKGELLEQFGADKTAILNADDPRVAAMSEGRAFAVRTFGIENPADCAARNVEARGFEGLRFTLVLGGEGTEISLSCIGRHNVMNALAAAAAARELGADIKTIAAGLEAFRPAAMRCRILDILRVKVINDTYNANPRSMDAALDTLQELAGEGRRVAVLGDMLELGQETESAHRRLGRHAAKTGVDRLFVLGDFADFVVEGALEEKMPVERIVRARSHGQIVETLRDYLRRGDVVLVKGSRGLRMELVTRGLKGEALP